MLTIAGGVILGILGLVFLPIILRALLFLAGIGALLTVAAVLFVLVTG
jgi:hypothetical protein